MQNKASTIKRDSKLLKLESSAKTTKNYHSITTRHFNQPSLFPESYNLSQSF